MRINGSIFSFTELFQTLRKVLSCDCLQIKPACKLAYELTSDPAPQRLPRLLPLLPDQGKRREE